MYLHCSNFSLDTATFTKPMDFKVELFPLVALLCLYFELSTFGLCQIIFYVTLFGE